MAATVGESRIRNSIKNMASGLLLQMITTVIQFIYRVFFIKLIGVEYLSVNGLFANILTIFSFAELGIGQAIVFSLYKPIAENDVERIKSLMRLYKTTYYCIGGIVFALGILFFPFYRLLLNGGTETLQNLDWIYCLFVFNSGISYFFSYRTSFLNANQKKYVLNLFSTLATIGMYIAQLAVLYFTRAYILVLITQVFFTVMQNAIASLIVGRMYPYLKERAQCLAKEDARNIIKNIKALIIYKVGTLALNSTDNIIISIFVGTLWVGYYSNYNSLVVSITSFATILFSSLTASIGNVNAIGTTSQKKHIFDITNLATFWVYTCIGTCLYVALNPFVGIFYGQQYVLSKLVVGVIVLNVYIGGMLYAPFNYRQTMGLFVYGKWRPIISAVVNIVVSIILAKRIGLAGVLLGTIIARLTTNGWYDPYIVYKHGLQMSPKKYYFDYLVKLICLCSICMLCDAISQFIRIAGIPGLIVKCLVSMIVANALIIALWRRTKEVAYLKDTMLRLVKKKR